MSLIKTNAVQIGQSPTATQNFTLAVPSSPNGTIKLARGNAGATTQDVMTVSNTGVVSFPQGLGNVITPNTVTTDTTQTITGIKTFSANSTSPAVTISNSNATSGSLVVTNVGNANAMRITQTGTGNCLVVQDASGDSTPFVISSDGNVTIGLPTSAYSKNLVTASDIIVNDVYIGRGTSNDDRNTAIGNSTLALSVSGTENTAVGYLAMQFNIGSGVTAIGNSALQVNTAANNTGIGNYALSSNTSGSNNTALGANALSLNVVGSNNTAIGLNALQNSESSGNTAVGNTALTDNTTGTNNTAVGAGSLANAITAADNTTIGGQSLNLTTGANNTAVGKSAGAANTTGASNVFIGRNCNGSSATVSNEVNISNGTVTARFAGAASAWSFVSDERDKKNIEDLTIGLDFINQLKARKFEWDIRDCDVDKGRQASGFIAQEVIQVIENNNAEYTGLVDTNNPDQYTFAASNLIPILVKAVQELSAKVEALESK